MFGSGVRFVFACVMTVAAAGCGKARFDYAPVSGRVTLDGEPVADAIIRFVPEKTGDSAIVGPSSVAVTDADGRYELRVSRPGTPRGAVPGRHEVRLDPVDDPASDEDEDVIVKVPRDAAGPRSFDVPPEGTSTADLTYTTGS
ncbi:MAG: hypothetical protein AAF532_15165 [Planctomycetota bacterium]